jgi:integrase
MMRGHFTSIGWIDKVAPKAGGSRKSASMGNRMVGNMRVLYDAYFAHLGDLDRHNPFNRLSFAEKFKKSRPPFPLDWVKTKILRPGALAAMNDEARAIVLTLIETGARPSEICNLTEPFIKLDTHVPHILIEPRLDPDDPREIKTATSVRTVPLRHCSKTSTVTATDRRRVHPAIHARSLMHLPVRLAALNSLSECGPNDDRKAWIVMVVELDAIECK